MKYDIEKIDEAILALLELLNLTMAAFGSV